MRDRTTVPTGVRLSTNATLSFIFISIPHGSKNREFAQGLANYSRLVAFFQILILKISKLSKVHSTRTQGNHAEGKPESGKLGEVVNFFWQIFIVKQFVLTRLLSWTECCNGRAHLYLLNCKVKCLPFKIVANLLFKWRCRNNREID